MCADQSDNTLDTYVFQSTRETEHRSEDVIYLKNNSEVNFDSEGNLVIHDKVYQIKKVRVSQEGHKAELTNIYHNRKKIILEVIYTGKNHFNFIKIIKDKLSKMMRKFVYYSTHNCNILSVVDWVLRKIGMIVGCVDKVITDIIDISEGKIKEEASTVSFTGAKYLGQKCCGYVNGYFDFIFDQDSIRELKLVIGSDYQLVISDDGKLSVFGKIYDINFVRGAQIGNEILLSNLKHDGVFINLLITYLGMGKCSLMSRLENALRYILNKSMISAKNREMEIVSTIDEAEINTENKRIITYIYGDIRDIITVDTDNIRRIDGILYFGDYTRAEIKPDDAKTDEMKPDYAKNDDNFEGYIRGFVRGINTMRVLDLKRNEDAHISDEGNLIIHNEKYDIRHIKAEQINKEIVISNVKHNNNLMTLNLKYFGLEKWLLMARLENAIMNMLCLRYIIYKTKDSRSIAVIDDMKVDYNENKIRCYENSKEIVAIPTDVLCIEFEVDSSCKFGDPNSCDEKYYGSVRGIEDCRKVDTKYLEIPDIREVEFGNSSYLIYKNHFFDFSNSKQINAEIFIEIKGAFRDDESKRYDLKIHIVEEEKEEREILSHQKKWELKSNGEAYISSCGELVIKGEVYDIIDSKIVQKNNEILITNASHDNLTIELRIYYHGSDEWYLMEKLEIAIMFILELDFVKYRDKTSRTIMVIDIAKLNKEKNKIEFFIEEVCVESFDVEILEIVGTEDFFKFCYADYEGFLKGPLNETIYLGNLQNEIIHITNLDDVEINSFGCLVYHKNVIDLTKSAIYYKNENDGEFIEIKEAYNLSGTKKCFVSVKCENLCDFMEKLVNSMKILQLNDQPEIEFLSFHTEFDEVIALLVIDQYEINGDCINILLNDKEVAMIIIEGETTISYSPHLIFENAQINNMDCNGEILSTCGDKKSQLLVNTLSFFLETRKGKRNAQNDD